MAKVKCPACNGNELEPVRCGRVFFCPVCDGDGVVEESVLKEKGVTAASYDQTEAKDVEKKRLEKPKTPGWISQVLHTDDKK